jgi:hypothetical protein
MDNNFLASMLRQAAPTMGAVGVALHVYDKTAQGKYRMGKTLASAFVAYHVSGWLTGKLLGLLEPGAGEIPTTPLMLPAPVTSSSTSFSPPATTSTASDMLPPGSAQAEGKIGSVTTLRRKPKPAPDFMGSRA